MADEPFPLSPSEAIAVAAVLDSHPRAPQHWHGWAVRLRTWGRANLPSEPANDSDHADVTPAREKEAER